MEHQNPPARESQTESRYLPRKKSRRLYQLRDLSFVPKIPGAPFSRERLCKRRSRARDLKRKWEILEDYA
jgi:hypothetical protein